MSLQPFLGVSNVPCRHVRYVYHVWLRVLSNGTLHVDTTLMDLSAHNPHTTCIDLSQRLVAWRRATTVAEWGCDLCEVCDSLIQQKHLQQWQWDYLERAIQDPALTTMVCRTFLSVSNDQVKTFCDMLGERHGFVTSPKPIIRRSDTILHQALKLLHAHWEHKGVIVHVSFEHGEWFNRIAMLLPDESSLGILQADTEDSPFSLDTSKRLHIPKIAWNVHVYNRPISLIWIAQCSKSIRSLRAVKGFTDTVSESPKTKTPMLRFASCKHIAATLEHLDLTETDESLSARTLLHQCGDRGILKMFRGNRFPKQIWSCPLTEIQLVRCSPTLFDLERFLPRAIGLQKLYFHNTTLCLHTLMHSIQSLPSLKVFSIKTAVTPSSRLEAFTLPANLCTLDIQGYPPPRETSAQDTIDFVFDQILCGLSSARNLEAIDIVRNDTRKPPVFGNWVEHVHLLTKLKHLYLENIPFSSESATLDCLLDSLSTSITSLTICNEPYKILNNAPWGVTGAKLSRLENLELIELSNIVIRLSDAIIPFHSLDKLEYLDIAFTRPFEIKPFLLGGSSTEWTGEPQVVLTVEDFANFSTLTSLHTCSLLAPFFIHIIDLPAVSDVGLIGCETFEFGFIVPATFANYLSPSIRKLTLMTSKDHAEELIKGVCLQIPELQSLTIDIHDVRVYPDEIYIDSESHRITAHLESLDCVQSLEFTVHCFIYS